MDFDKGIFIHKSKLNKGSIMKIIFAFIFASVVMLGNTMPPNAYKAQKKVDKYTCIFDANNPFPDGTTGISEIGVKVTGKGNTFVTVEYYSDDYTDYLGQFEEGNGDFVPSTMEEACQFAFDHYGDRQ